MLLPLNRLCRLSSLPWRRWFNKALVVSLVLPHLAAASTLEPIKLRKPAQTKLEPIQLKRPASLSSGLPAWSPIKPDGVEETPYVTPLSEVPAQLAPVISAPVAQEVKTSAVDDQIPAELQVPVPVEVTLVKDKKPDFNQRIQSLADGTARRRPVEAQAGNAQMVLPVGLARVSVSEADIRDDDKTINTIIDIADLYADMPQLLLEVRGLAPMTATNQERQMAYQNAQLVMSGLVSAGVPYYRLAAFVTLMEAAPGSVDIIRTR